MAWACMAACGTGSQVCIYDVTAERCSGMRCEVYKAMLSAQIQQNAGKVIRKHFTLQMDNDPKQLQKQTKAMSISRKRNWILLKGQASH